LARANLSKPSSASKKRTAAQTKSKSQQRAVNRLPERS